MLESLEWIGIVGLTSQIFGFIIMILFWVDTEKQHYELWCIFKRRQPIFPIPDNVKKDFLGWMMNVRRTGIFMIIGGLSLQILQLAID